MCRALRSTLPLMLVMLLCGVEPARAQTSSTVLPPVDADASLPSDPALLSGQLENGLRYLVLQHDRPSGRVYLNLRVDVGSLDELDHERGMARFAQELALGWAKGDTLDRLEDRGLSVIEDLTGRTSYDLTNFALALPGTDSLEDGLSVMARVARGGLVDSATTASVTRSIVASLRARGGGAARARAQWLEDLGGASLFGRRPPEGDLESINSITPEGAAVFRKRWYHAGNMTLCVVGDMDPERTLELIRDSLGTIEGGIVPERQSRGVSRAGQVRAVIGSDPEIGRAQLAVLRIAPVQDPVRTADDLRRYVLEQTAMLAMEVRLRSAMSEGRLNSDGLRVYVADLYRSMRYTQIATRSDPESWEADLRQLCIEVQRVREHGFLPGEVTEARHRMEARLESLVDGRPSVNSRDLVRWLNHNDAQGHAWIDPAQELAFTRRILLEADAQQLGSVFRSLMPAGEEALLVSAPNRAAPTSREPVRRIGLDALTMPTTPPEEPASFGRLSDRLPEPGEIVEIRAHPTSGVWSAVMGNNARVHHVRRGGDRVIIQLSLSGSDRVSHTNQLTLVRAAAFALNNPALPGLGSIGVRRIMVESGLELKAWERDGRLHLRIQGDAEHVTTAMELAGRLLSDPMIEPPTFERWKWQEASRLVEEHRDPLAQADLALEGMLHPTLAAGPTPDQVMALPIDEARGFLRSLLQDGAVEVALVGNVSRTEAFELGEQFIGALPPRAWRDERASRAPDDAGPFEGAVDVETMTPVAGVIVGVLIPDAGQVREAHLLSLAARVLERRLTRALRDERGLVDRAPVEVSPGLPGSGHGVLLVRVETAPEWAERIADLIQRELARMGSEGPTEAELASEMRRIEIAFTDALDTPSFWAGRLADLERSSRSLDDIVGVLDRQDTFTPSDVREALRRALTQRQHVRVIALPQGL